MDGFFTDSEFRTVQNVQRISGCGACGLHKTCNHPQMEPTGKGEKGILIIAEAPGRTEDERGVQLVGDAGQLLRRKLRWQGIDLDRDCRKTNAVCCRPPDNRLPTKEEIAYCRPRVWKEIETFKPQMIVLAGQAAITSFLGHRWKGEGGLGGITKWRGWTIPDRDVNAWVLPIFHPSYVLRMLDSNPAVERTFELDLICMRKYLEVPLYQPTIKETAGVQVVEDQAELCELLYKIYDLDDCIAFDYEATGLKPHRAGHRIVCMSIATTEHAAIAFDMPKQGTKAFGLIKKILTSPRIRKMAHNAKFEDNWTNVILGYPIQGWYWDSMLAAHVLDNRSSITGLKFQSYVNFGVLDYSSHLHRYLEGVDDKDANSFNRIDEAPRKEMLIYNGIDSILEFRLAVKQQALLGFDRFNRQEEI